MTLQQLRYFLALSEEQNFTRAATRCGITQPSLTRAVKELEAEFGGPLFVRSRSSSRLSRLGMILRPHFAIIEQAVADAKRDAANFLSGRSTPMSKPTLTLPNQPKERPMRKVALSTAIVALLLALAAANLRQPRIADAASPEDASIVKGVYAIQSTIDVKALPRQDILSEADE